MKVTNKIKTPITIDGVTIPGNATTYVPGRLKHNQRYKQLVSRGTLVDSVDKDDAEALVEQLKDDVNDKPRRWFPG